MRDEPSSPRSAGRRRSRRPLSRALPLLGALLLGTATGVGIAAAIHMPQVDSLVDYTPSLVTQLFDRQGQVFQTYARERRVMIRREDVPPVLERALLASEDSNFFQHGGIDAMGVVRAGITDLKAGRVVEGASTITMQLARSLYLSRDRTWRRKIEEALLAVELEKNYSKEQILTLYLNLVNLGHGNYGVEAASHYYFAKPAKELTLAEAATLVGIIPAPSRYSPYRTPDLMKRQRERVLRRMLEEGYISRQEYEVAQKQGMLVATQVDEQAVAPYFGEEIRKYLEATYGATALYQNGLAVQTTLDPQIQASTEKALRTWLLRLDHRRGYRGPITKLTGKLDEQTLPTWGRGAPVPGRWYQGLVLTSGDTEAEVRIGKNVYPLGARGIAWTNKRRPADLLASGAVAWFRLEVPRDKEGKEQEGAEPFLVLEQQPRMEGAAVVIENKTGAVRAMVGGWDFERNKFNRITQARRQVGSSFKPLVYGAALEMGWTPSDTLLDAPISLRGADGRLSYRPQNYTRKFSGIVTLRRALEQSLNVPAVKLFDLVGGSKVVDFAHRTGIKTKLPTWPSIALGSADLTPLEVAAAYATIANQGTHIEPYWIEKVTGADGQLLEQHFPGTYSAIEPKFAYILTHMMEGVVDHGTAFELAKLPLAIAGKTGTTDDYSDAWFAGFTPQYTIVTWVGNDAKRTLGHGMTGSAAALPMWRLIAEDGLATGWLTKDEPFPMPAGVSLRDVEHSSGLLAGNIGKQTVKEAFVTGTEPSQGSDPRWSAISNLPWFQQKAFYIPKEGEKMPAKEEPQVPDPASPENLPPP